MTAERLRTLAENALYAIRRVSPGHVIAARRGIVAAAKFRSNEHVVFRRVNGVVRLELWPSDMTKEEGYHALPADLQEIAGKMLDSL